MGLFSFSRNKRLLTKKDYAFVFEKPLKVHFRGFLLLARENFKSENARIGFIIGKKKVKKAVNRNKIKRLVREAFRVSRFEKSLDIIFLARYDLAELTDKELKQCLEKAFSKLKKRY